MASRAWKRILVHHSAGKDGIAADRDAIRRQHIEVNGWLDIGYHAVIEQVGPAVIALPGRPETMHGSHCPGHNTTALGICVVGNFELEEPSEKHVEALIGKLAEWCAEYGIPVAAIHGHRDFRATLCPGQKLYVRLPSIRAAVADILID